MTSTLRFAGAAALVAALLLGACAKKTTDQTTTTSTDTAGSTPAPAGDAMTPVPEASSSTEPGGAAATSAGGATSAPDATATAGATMAAMSGSASNGASNGFITLPVYPGASQAQAGSISTSSNTGSVDIKWYTTKDDSKKVVDWYKANLPSSFQNFEISANGKTTGSFSDEHKDNSGDQSVIITADNTTNETRIQLATKHGH